MNTKFHYVVKAKLIRLVKTDSIDFLEFEKKFENKNPIEAREQAFRYYQNYIDVLLQAKGKEYVSDEITRLELASFIDPIKPNKITIDKNELELNEAFGNGIGIFFVIDDPLDYYNVGQEFQIHGIGFLDWANDPQMLMDALNSEMEYYNHYNYDTKDFLQKVDFFEYDIAKSESNEILRTPFDWTGYEKPFAGEVKDLIDENDLPYLVKLLIDNGETNQVEFKTNLLFNHKTGKPGISIKGIIAKAICAFLNSKGGFIVIGVTDDKTIQGLDSDLNLALEKDPKDFFRLEFDDMISHFLSFSIKNRIDGKFVTIDDKEIFLVTVSPSLLRPIFLNGLNGKEFYVRGEASSRQLIDIEELVNYCLDRWSTRIAF